MARKTKEAAPNKYEGWTLDQLEAEIARLMAAYNDPAWTARFEVKVAERDRAQDELSKMLEDRNSGLARANEASRVVIALKQAAQGVQS